MQKVDHLGIIDTNFSNSSRRNPGGYYGMASVVRHPKDPLSTGAQLVASVFVLVCGHFSALGVKFFDRFLTFASAFWFLGVSGACSIVGVCHDIS